MLRYILYACPKSIVVNLTTCTHGAHKIHSCKNKGVHTAKPFRVYRRGPWPRLQMRPLTACTDEAVTLATLARTIRVHLRPWPRTIRVYLRPQKARAQPTPWPMIYVDIWTITKILYQSFSLGGLSKIYLFYISTDICGRCESWIQGLETLRDLLRVPHGAFQSRLPWMQKRREKKTKLFFSHKF